MLAAMVGMVGIIFGTGFMNGIFSLMLDGAIESGLGHVQIRTKNYLETRKAGMAIEHPQRIKSQLEKIKYLKNHQVKYSARFEREAMLKLDSNVQGVMTIGIDPSSEKKISKFDEWLVKGSYLDKNRSKHDLQFNILPALIGEANAKKFELEVNDTAIIAIGSFDGSPKSTRIRIVGIYHSISNAIDKSMVVLKREDLSRLYHGKKTSVSSFVFVAKELTESGILKNLLKVELNNKNIEVSSYKQLQPGLSKMIEMSGSFMGIFYLILMSGFALTLLNAILMSVLDRTREIGVLMAIGTRRKIIFWMVVFESEILAMIGSLAGLLAGGFIVLITNQSGFSLSSFAKGLELMAKTGTTIYPFLGVSDIFLGLGIAFLMSLLASVYPAWKAIKMQPVKAIYNR